MTMPKGAAVRTRPDSISAMAAYLLGNWPEPVAMRCIIRAALPPGMVPHDAAYFRRKLHNLPRGKPPEGQNTITHALQDALRKFEVSGWIRRGRLFVRIDDPDSLLSFCDGMLREPRILNLSRALAAAEDELEGALRLNEPQFIASVQAQRRALQLLMKAPVWGIKHSGRDSVRRVPHGANRP